MNHAIAALDTAEAQLIENAQKGDRQAFGELVTMHHQGVFNITYRMCGDVHLAEDVAQDAFIRAWQNLPRYQPRAAFKSWLYRIAHNAMLDVFRKQRETVDVDEVQIPAEGESMDERLERKDRAAQVQRAVLSLPPASRAVLVLREYESLSYQEIAETLDIPIGTVMSRLNFARGKMRDLLSDLMEDV